jgi:bifunctional UDP-N-acetylglucosamine pyrophosphorylase/glucosamine-1-phosphate N-acetyltransferase
MNSKQTAIIILAAGKGTRMKSKTPKVLHEICGKTMIGHVIDTAISLNSAKIITVLGHGMEDVASEIQHTSSVVIQENQNGTADAVKPALKELQSFDGNILILYADTPLITRETLEQMLNGLKQSDIVVLGFRPEDPAEYGRLVVNSKNELIKIIEFKDASGQEREINLCNSGVIAAKSYLLQHLIDAIDNKNAKGEYYLTDIIGLAKNAGKKCTYVEGDEDEVLGVNNRVQLSEAEYIYQNRLRANAMVDGVTFIDPETVYLCHDTKLESDVTLHPNVTFGKNVWVESGVVIKPFCHIEGTKIKSGAVVGPFARLRPGSEIGADAHIGNFVEIKKSKIGQSVKIGHLSYIGDSIIGSNSNIGAGTITCNYDGYHKHETIIGSGVFIGSNSALVAPVKIGDGSFIGAGSVITKNIEDNALAVSRSKQINKENWAKNFRKNNTGK